MSETGLIALAGIHHVRLPVSDLRRSIAFWADFLGYEVNFEFPGEDGPLGVALKHSNGGPNVVLWRDPVRAKQSSGFPWFAVGCRDADEIRELQAQFDAHGVANGGIQTAFVGIKLPFVEDPDGNLIGFYVVSAD